MSSLDSNTYNRQSWESSDFPSLCETCLGDNPYVRMTKLPAGGQCKICTRPFTVFRWCPGTNARYKKTQVCQTCAKIKNVCQTCIFDLQFGLPTQVRDTLTGSGASVIPSSDVNKEYFTQNMERQLANTDGTTAAFGLGADSNEALLRLARTTPYYKRNRAHICSFWVKGECKRGEECPYRHEMPTDPNDPLAQQNIKDRYYGVNDPVANKMLRRNNDNSSSIEPPEDKSITTLFLGNLSAEITEQDIRGHFYQFGELRKVHMVTRQSVAFVEFASREAAEEAARRSFNRLTIKEKQVNVMWGRARGAQLSAAAIPQPESVPGLPGAVPLPSFGYQSAVNSALPPPPPASAPAQPTFTTGLLPVTTPAAAPAIPAATPLAYGMTSAPFPGYASMAPPAPAGGRQPPTIHGTNLGIYYPSMDPHRMGAGKGPRQ